MKRKSLVNLIKVRKNAVEEIQKKFSEELDKLEFLKNQLALVEEQVEKEKLALNSDLIVSSINFSNFLNNAKFVKDKLREEIRAQDIVVNELMDRLSLAYKDQKSVELVEEKRLEEEKIELARKEAQEVDELGGQMYIRRGDSLNLY